MTDCNAVLAELRGFIPFASDADRQNAFKAVFFGSDDGRRVLAEMVKISGYHTPLFDAGTELRHADALVVAAREGRRLNMLDIINILGSDPTKEPTIEKEEPNV